MARTVKAPTARVMVKFADDTEFWATRTGNANDVRNMLRAVSEAEAEGAEVYVEVNRVRQTPALYAFQALEDARIAEVQARVAAQQAAAVEANDDVIVALRPLHGDGVAADPTGFALVIEDRAATRRTRRTDLSAAQVTALIAGRPVDATLTTWER